MQLSGRSHCNMQGGFFGSSLQACIAVTGILGQFGLPNRSNRVLTQSVGISFALLRKLNDLFG